MSAFVDVSGNFPKTISEAYCSSWAFSNMLKVAEIFPELFTRLK